MADRYWRGGAGTWNTTSTTNWSDTSGGTGGFSVPTASDNVIFDQAATYSVVMTGALACLSITVSAGTVSFTTGTTPTLQVNGSMSLIAMTWTSTGAITFNATTSGQTITTGGTTINAPITFNGVGGEWSLGSALTTGATQTTTLTNGSLILNGYDLTTGIFSSTNTNTRSIAFGANNIILAHTTAAQTVLSMAIATGFTYTSSGTFGSTTGTFQATMSTTRTFVFGTTGGSITNAPRLYLVSGASVATITTGSWWSEIHFGTCSFTIAATNQNLSSLVSNNSTSNLVALTATMVGTGTIATNTTIGPLVINNGASSGTTTLYSGTTTCTTCTLTSGTFDNAGQTLTCSSTFTWTSGSLISIGALNCTIFTLNGPTFDFTGGTITPSTSFVVTSGSFTYNGGTLASVTTFTHTAGTVQFNYSYTMNTTVAACTYTFTAGTLTLNDSVTLSTGIFSSSNANPRTINFGLTAPGYIGCDLAAGASATVLNMAIVTGLTINAIQVDWGPYGPYGISGGGVPSGGFTANSAEASGTYTNTYVFGTTGGTATNAPNLQIGGPRPATLTTGSWFNELNTVTFARSGLLSFGTTSLNVNSFAANGSNSVVYTGVTLTFRGTGNVLCGGIGSPVSIAAAVFNSTSTTFYDTLTTVTTITITAGVLNCRYWSNGPFEGYGGIAATTTITQTGGSWQDGRIWILAQNGTSAGATTYTINGATVEFSSGTVTLSTSLVVTSGAFTYNDGTFSAVPTFTHTAGTVTFNKSYALTVTGTYTQTAGSLVLARGSTLNTGIFSSTGAGTRSISFGSTISSAATGSVLFDGSTQYLTVPSSNDLTFGTGDFTVEGWYYFNSFGVDNGLALLGTGANGGTDYSAWWMRYYTGGLGNFLSWYRYDGGAEVNYEFPLTAALNAGQWYHIACTRSGTDLRFFVNGTQIGAAQTCATDYTIINSNPLQIGKVQTGNGLFYLNGNVSNIRIVKGVAVYTATFTPPAGPLANNQTANTNGNPSAAITVTQTSLLLNTVYGSTFLNDSSYYDFTITNNGTATTSNTSPYFANINLTHTTAATVVLNLAALGGFSYTGSGGFTVADMSNTRTFSVGNTSSNSSPPNLTFTTGASIATLSTGSWFNNLDFGTTSFAIAATALNITGGLTLSSSGTYTNLTASMLDPESATLTTNGKTIAALTFNGPGGAFTLAGILTVTGALTLTAGTVNTVYAITSASFASAGPYSRSIIGPTTYTISGAGATAWSFSSAPTGSLSFDGVSSFLAIPANAAFNFSTGDFTIEEWINCNNLSTISSPFSLFSNNTGSYIVGQCELEINTDGTISFVYATGVSATASLTTTTAITANTWYHVAVVRSGTGVGNLKIYINGSLAATSAGAVIQSMGTTGAGRIGLNANTAGNFIFSGLLTNIRLAKIAVYTGNFTVPTTILTPRQLADTNISAMFGSETSFLLPAPTDANLVKDYSVNNITVTNNGPTTSSIVSPFAVTSPTINFTGFTINMTNAAAKTFAGGGATYPVLNNGGAGALTISGSNTFETISNSVQPTTFTFTINTTQTVNNFNVAGIAGSLVTINSSTAATAATLSKASGTVYGSYLSIRDSTATGGATWYAGPTSTNTSNNTGWIFARLPIVTFGNLTVADGGFTVSDDPVVF